MSIVLPKSSTREVIVPIDTTAQASVPGTSGTWGSYVTFTTTNMNEFVLHGLYYHCVFTESLADFSGALPEQIELALGGAGSEVPLVKVGLQYGIQFGTGTGGFAQIGAAGLLRVAPVIIPSGSTVRIRSVTGNAHSLNQRVFMVGYKSSQGFPLIRPNDMDFYEHWLRGTKTSVVDATDAEPDGAYTTIATPAGTAWASYGTTVEMIASAPTDLLITQMIVTIVNAISINTTAGIEIGIGSSGNEDWENGSLIGAPGAASMPGPGGGFYPLLRPLWVRKGQRVACRAKGTASKTFTIALVYDSLKG